MADPQALPRVRGNVEKMIGMGAPEADIDDYLRSEGHTPESFRAAVKPAAPERSFGERAWEGINTGVNWLGSRAVGAAASLGGMGSQPMEPVKQVVQGVDWRGGVRDFGESAPISAHVMARAAPAVNRMMKYAFPDAATIKGAFYDLTGAPEVNLPGTAGKIIDTGVEAALGARAFPGGAARNMAAGFGAGVGSESGGQMAQGARWEPAARLVGGLIGGATGAGVAEATAATGRGVRNLVGANDTDRTAARVVSRAFERDKVQTQYIPNRMAVLGDDAMPLDAGGANVRGTLRGATMSPGEARTIKETRFKARDEMEAPAVSASIDRNISGKGLTQAVDELITSRRNAAAPAYEAAGVPGDPKVYAQAPQLGGQAVRDLIANSVDVRRAIATARRLPDYKDLPDTSMVMLDKAYKHIGGMADAAKRQGNGERFRDLDSLRVTLRDAIAAENPKYIDALAAFSGPSRLIDAATAGQKAFAGNVAPAAVRRDFTAMSPDAQEAFLVGVAEHLNKRADARGATGIAGRVINPRDEQRLRGILPPERFDAFMADISSRKTFTANQRGSSANSTTTPSLMEAGDATAQIGGDVAASLAQGRPVSAVMSALSGFGRRVGQGQNERVNARIAEMLTNGSPEARRALIDALERSLLDQRIASPANTFRAGAGAAALSPVSQPGDPRRDRPR